MDIPVSQADPLLIDMFADAVDRLQKAVAPVMSLKAELEEITSKDPVLESVLPLSFLTMVEHDISGDDIGYFLSEIRPGMDVYSMFEIWQDTHYAHGWEVRSIKELEDDIQMAVEEIEELIGIIGDTCDEERENVKRQSEFLLSIKFPE